MGTLKTPHISTHYLHILIMSSHQRLLSSTSRRALSRYASTSYFSNSAAGSSHSFSSVGAAQHHLVFKNNNINNINNKKHVFSPTTGSHDDFAAKSHVDASNAHENRLGRCERNRGDLHERKSERPSVRFFKRRLSHFRPLRDPVRVEKRVSLGRFKERNQIVFQLADDSASLRRRGIFGRERYFDDHAPRRSSGCRTRIPTPSPQ